MAKRTWPQEEKLKVSAGVKKQWPARQSRADY